MKIWHISLLSPDICPKNPNPWWRPPATLDFTQCDFVHQSPCMANSYLCTKFNTNICIGNRDMAKNKNSRWWPRHLEFYQKWDIGHSNLCIFNIYLRAKFDADIFTSDRDIAKKFQYNTETATILNFSKSTILSPSDPPIANIYQQTKCGAIRSIKGTVHTGNEIAQKQVGNTTTTVQRFQVCQLQKLRRLQYWLYSVTAVLHQLLSQTSWPYRKKYVGSEQTGPHHWWRL